MLDFWSTLPLNINLILAPEKVIFKDRSEDETKANTVVDDEGITVKTTLRKPSKAAVKDEL